MDYNVFANMITGYKNISKNLNSQDFLEYKILKDSIICCVADGHSTDFFKYSDMGSKLACKVSIDILTSLADLTKSELQNKLKNYEIQKNIYAEWMKLVDENYKSNNPLISITEYIKYSTTLVAILLTDEYRLYLKIGDGNIIVKDNKDFKELIKTKNNKIVDSLGRIDAYKNIMYLLEDNKDNKSIILFTDGYEKGFPNNELLYKSLDETIKIYNKNVFSRERLKKTYKSQLNKLSKYTSQDDISIIFLI